MKEAMIKFVTVNFGIVVMWVGGVLVCYKILDRPSGWALLPVVLIMVVIGAATDNILSPKTIVKPKTRTAKKK